MLSGDKIKYIRSMKQKSQVEVAKWAGISDRYLGMIEAGQKIPDEETYSAIINGIYGIGEPRKKAKKAVDE